MGEPHIDLKTQRTRQFRAKSLNESEKRTIDRIEKFGCEVVQVKAGNAGPGWSYTVGVYDTCGRPEIITVALNEKTAHYLLNQAASEQRKGVNLAVGRHRELVGEVECEFRPVDPRWVEQLMGWAKWYYGGIDFPVLQAVYPDLENRFPEEPGFDETFRQPLLQPNRTFTTVEEDFWASTDPASSLFDWKFPDPPHTRVYLSKAVHIKAELITYVSHDMEDGAWQFLGDSMAGEEDGVLSCLHHPVDNDRSLIELADLPLGWWAERAKPSDPWIRYQHEPEGSSED